MQGWCYPTWERVNVSNPHLLQERIDVLGLVLGVELPVWLQVLSCIAKDEEEERERDFGRKPFTMFTRRSSPF
jgi:hypothetical protein